MFHTQTRHFRLIFLIPILDNDCPMSPVSVINLKKSSIVERIWYPDGIWLPEVPLGGSPPWNNFLTVP